MIFALQANTSRITQTRRAYSVYLARIRGLIKPQQIVEEEMNICTLKT
jgi:hypothetical protein